MQISVKPALRSPGTPMPVAAQWESEPVELDGHVEFSQPVHFRGSAQALGDTVKLTGTAATELRFLCDRCGEPFAMPFTIDLEEEFHQNDEFYPLVNGELELIRPVMDNLLSNLPIRRLCAPNCKGLCPGCGQNRNQGPCECEK